MNATGCAGKLASFRRMLFTIAAVTALLVPASAGASLIITVGNVSAASPSSSNSLEVDLINTGLSAVSLAGFTFEIAVADPHITFTSATINTLAAYAFAGNSLLGPMISTSAPGQTLDAMDLWSGLGAASIAAGATVGLGHVLFDVAAGALTGPVSVTLASSATALFDVNGNNISIDQLTSGSITITGLVVPEPSALALVLLGLMMVIAGTSLSGRSGART